MASEQLETQKKKVQNTTVFVPGYSATAEQLRCRDLQLIFECNYGAHHTSWETFVPLRPERTKKISDTGELQFSECARVVRPWPHANPSATHKQCWQITLLRDLITVRLRPAARTQHVSNQTRPFCSVFMLLGMFKSVIATQM